MWGGVLVSVSYMEHMCRAQGQVLTLHVIFPGALERRVILFKSKPLIGFKVHFSGHKLNFPPGLSMTCLAFPIQQTVGADWSHQRMPNLVKRKREIL